MFAMLMGLKSISPADVNALVARRAVTVIDVNSEQSFAKARVPGARNLVAAVYVPDDLPAAKDAPLVFYCSNPLCRKAPIAARRAKEMGYRNAMVMSAGINGWIAAGLPTQCGAA